MKRKTKIIPLDELTPMPMPTGQEKLFVSEQGDISNITIPEGKTAKEMAYHLGSLNSKSLDPVGPRMIEVLYREVPEKLKGMEGYNFSPEREEPGIK